MIGRIDIIQILCWVILHLNLTSGFLLQKYTAQIVYEADALQESIKLMEFCNNDFELFAKKTQYDENFRNKLKQESSPLDMNYGDFILTQDVCIVRSTMIQKMPLSMDIRIIIEKHF